MPPRFYSTILNGPFLGQSFPRTVSRSFQIILVLLLGFWFPIELSGFTGEIDGDPSRLVEKYLSLDKRGARLVAESQEVLAPYVSWTEEPAWGRIIVISKYHVIEDVTQWEILTETEMLIPVTFDVVGIMYWETATFLQESQVSLEYFHVKALDERWRIVAPQIPPHVGRKRLLDFVRFTQLQESRETQKMSLQQLREQLQQIP